MKKRTRPRRARRRHDNQVEVGSSYLFEEGVTASLRKQAVIVRPSENIHVHEFKLAMDIMLAIVSFNDLVHACLEVSRAFHPSEQVSDFGNNR